MSRMPRLFVSFVALLVLLAGLAVPAAGAPPITRTLVPIGSDYTEVTLQRFAREAAQRDTSGNVYILVLPITYATDAYSISAKERRDNLSLADGRRGQIETACDAVRATSQTCQVVLAPILVRHDAYLP